MWRRTGRAGAMRAVARAYFIMRVRGAATRVIRRIRWIPYCARRFGPYPSDALHPMDTLRCGKSFFTFDTMCVIPILHPMDTLRCGKSLLAFHTMCVIPKKKMIPSEMSNGGVLLRSALPIIRGVPASLNGGRPNSSPYSAWSLSAVNRGIGDTVSRYDVCDSLGAILCEAIPWAKLAADDWHTSLLPDTSH